MADITLNYVNSYRDPRNGKMRHQFRRKGCRKIMLKGRPGSAEFMDHYAELLAQSENAAAQIGASKIKPGSIDALIVKYLQARHLHQGTGQGDTGDARRPILDNFRQCMTPGGHRYGENRLATMQRKNIADALAGKTPIMQKVWMKALRHLIAFAIEQGECKTDPTIGIKTTRPPKTSGHVTWGDVQIEQYREQHANGTMARLALELMLNIAARRHDAHQIGRQHLRNGCLSWRPSKTSQTTGKMLTIRVLPELQAALDAMPQQRRADIPADRIRQAVRVGGGIRQQVRRLVRRGRAGAGASAMTARSATIGRTVCARRRASNSRTPDAPAPEIMAVSGHASLSEVQMYIDAVEQDRLAEAAMVKRAAGSNRAQTVTNIYGKGD